MHTLRDMPGRFYAATKIYICCNHFKLFLSYIDFHLVCKTFMLPFFAFAFIASSVVELTSDNWDRLVIESGKSSFVKFYAPWCGHCKKMKPDWEKLGEEADKFDVLIGDVDCTSSSGKPLCDKNDVKGFPTLKTFWKHVADDYSGARGFEDLRQFVSTLKPPCSPDNIDACSSDQTAEIQKLQKMEDEELENELKNVQEKMTAAGKKHETLLSALQNVFEASNEQTDSLKGKLGKVENHINTINRLRGKEMKKDEL